MVETDKVKIYTQPKTMKARITFIEENIAKARNPAIMRVMVDTLKQEMMTSNLEYTQHAYDSMLSTAKGQGIIIASASGLTDDEVAAVETFSAKHKGGPRTWTPDQIKYLALVNRPSKSGNITSKKKALEHLTTKCLNNLKRAAKDKLWTIGNATIKAPPAKPPTPPKEKTVIIQEVPQEGA